jgi:hypothetical protein
MFNCTSFTQVNRRGTSITLSDDWAQTIAHEISCLYANVHIQHAELDSEHKLVPGHDDVIRILLYLQSPGSLLAPGDVLLENMLHRNLLVVYFRYCYGNCSIQGG